MWMQSVMGVSTQQLLTYCTEDGEYGEKEGTLKMDITMVMESFRNNNFRNQRRDIH